MKTRAILFVSAILLGIATLAGIPTGQGAGLPVRAHVAGLAADSVPVPATPTPPPPSPTVPPPTATAIPTLTAAPTQPPPSVTPGKVDAVHSTYYTDSGGYIHVIGDVTNGLDYSVSFVTVTVALSSGGTLVTSDNTIAVLETIPAGGTSPFEDILLPSTPSFDSIDVEATDYHATGDFDPPLISGLTVTLGTPSTDSIGDTHVPFTVTNASGTTYQFVQVYLAFYDSSGSMVLLGNDFSSPTTLAPGQSGTGEVLFLAGYSPQISTSATFVTASPPS